MERNLSVYLSLQLRARPFVYASNQQQVSSFVKGVSPYQITPIVDVFMVFGVRLLLCDLCSHLSLISI